MKLKFYFDHVIWDDTTNVYLVGEDASGFRHLAKPMEIKFEKRVPGLTMPPTLQFVGDLSREFFPALVSGLAESGYRYESSDAGELKAIKLHLADLQKLVFK